MPKKQPRNAFWYFMLEWKTRQEAQGRVFPNGFRDVQADPQCSTQWTNMSAQQKQPFMIRSKQSKDSKKGKQTTLGESVQQIKDEEQQEIDFRLNMDAHIRHTVFTAKKYNAVPSLKFLFLHMNWYYMREPDHGPVDFCPAEFAIAEFSLENGLTEYYHEIIKTDLYLGYTREALETSEKTHKLRWDLPFGEADWSVIHDKFISFLAPRVSDGKFPPIYTSKKNAHVIPSLLRRMTAASRDGNTIDMFLIYTVEALFGNVLRAVSDHADSNMVNVIAQNQLDKELFAYTPNIECDYHRRLDGTSQFCSLSIVRQWGLTFCDSCCQPLKIEMVPGIHCPETAKMLLATQSFYDDASSYISSMVPSVLSATGVSQEHRIRRSERRRGDESSMNGGVKFEIIDHSKRNKDEHEDKPDPDEQYEAVEPAPRPSRDPPTASQAVMGARREAPNFNSVNFPVIGGRGKLIKRDEPRPPQLSVWARRNRKSSDSE